MMEEIIKSLKYERSDLDPDLTCDYNIIMGDLNYRLNSNFEEMMAKYIKNATEVIDEKDQLKISMRGGNLPTVLANGQTLFRPHSPKYPFYDET